MPLGTGALVSVHSVRSIYEQVAQCSQHMVLHPQGLSLCVGWGRGVEGKKEKKNLFLSSFICEFCVFVAGVIPATPTASQFVALVQLTCALATLVLCKTYIMHTSIYLCLREIVVAKGAGRDH